MIQLNTALVAVIIAAVGVIVSVLSTLAIVAYRVGGASNRLTTMENNMGNMATRDQLSAVKEDIAEIKGMFRMTLKE
jgi:hypothetical protein